MIKQHTVRGSGIELQIRPISQILMSKMQSRFVTPPPPTVEVEFNGRKVREPNAADPDYQIQLAQFQIKMEAEWRKLLIRRGIVMNLTEAQLAEVSELREYMLENHNLDLKDENDLEVFVSYIAVQTAEDLADLQEAVTGLVAPTEKSDPSVDKTV